jgi:RHS repeat-associated protein
MPSRSARGTNGRLRQENHYDESVYTFDAADRLTDIDGVSYMWDANGNLIQAGNRSLAYDHANRLISLTAGPETYAFAYNGLGDRLSQSLNGEVVQYTLDLNAGLTQVLGDGPNTYLYGMTRIGQQGPSGWAYHLPDALGSVRQMADPVAAAIFAQSYEPYGNVLDVSGEARTPFGFAGEWMDRTGLMHLRARYYAPYFGTFIQPDPWPGSGMAPDTLHPYLYAGANPIVYRDPSGRCWGPVEFLRDTALYGQTCSNMDMAWTITTSAQASVGNRLLAASYLTTEGLAHTVALGGSAVACLGGGCEAIAGAAGGLLSAELFTYAGMTYAGLDAVFLAMDLGAIGYDTYLLVSSGSCADDQLRAKLFADLAGLGLDLVAPGLGRGTGGGLKLATQGGRAGAGALEVARAGAQIRSLQSVYKILQVGGPTILMAASDGDDSSTGNAPPSVGNQTPPRRVKFTSQGQIQHAFDRHKSHFGLGGKWNPQKGKLLQEIIEEHVESPSVRQIPGTYRGRPVIHYLNEQTGLNVFTYPNGDLWSGWILGPEQLRSVLTSGSLR